MIQQEFARRAISVAENDPAVIGLAVAGSWLTNELDEFSDLDLILVTRDKVSGNKEKMIAYAKRFGQLLSGFTGEHVGEPRVLICLYDQPLLHVDIKFLTLEEFGLRIETPVILFDRDGQLQAVLNSTSANFPYPDYQWVEDRFWIWIHYALLKVGRGEYMEAMDFLSYLRMMVFGPLLHIKNGQLPRGVRKVETALGPADHRALALTITSNDRKTILLALDAGINLYRQLRKLLFTDAIRLQDQTEKRVMEYFLEISGRESK